MAMGRTQDVWPSVVNGTVDHERGGIQQPHVATVDDLPVVVDLDEIALLDEGEGNTERVDPEGGRVDGIPQRDVSRDALIEAVFACGCGKIVSCCSCTDLWDFGISFIPKMRKAAASLPFR